MWVNQKTIPDFPGYFVTDCGRILSAKFPGRALKHGVDARGYCRQPLRRADGKVVCHYVHRLVALAFLPPAPAETEVDHVDGNPRNNAVGNLRWVTHRENITSAMARNGNWLSASPKNKTPILRIDSETGEERRFDSVRAAVQELIAQATAKGGKWAPRGAAGNICHARDKPKIAYGYFWVSPRKRLSLAMIRQRFIPSRA